MFAVGAGFKLGTSQIKLFCRTLCCTVQKFNKVAPLLPGAFRTVLFIIKVIKQLRKAFAFFSGSVAAVLLYFHKAEISRNAFGVN